MQQYSGVQEVGCGASPDRTSSHFLVGLSSYMISDATFSEVQSIGSFSVADGVGDEHVAVQHSSWVQVPPVQDAPTLSEKPAGQL